MNRENLEIPLQGHVFFDAKKLQLKFIKIATLGAK